ncbi:MAG: SDR family NAD(P)-dependent oxidoreductase, partial [Achromobacter pestifer]
MNTPSQQRVALVTGGSRGIGAAIVRRLARDGFAVGINYASSAAEADALADEIRQAGGRATAVRADVSKA